MSISRVKTWSDGQVLTAGDLNAEFDNILNNATNLISPLTGNLNAGFFRINNLRLDQATQYAVTTTSNVGRIAFHPTDGVLLLSVGATGPFQPIGPQTNQPTRVSGLIGAMFSNLGSFQALGYTMKTTTGLMFGVSATSSFSIDTRAVGPAISSRDQAAAFASTTAHFYAISTGAGSTSPQGIVSSNPPPTGPTLPSGYSGWCYLGSGIYDVAASGMIRTHVITGNEVEITNTLLVSGGTATSATTVGCGGFVPTIAQRFKLQFGPNYVLDATGTVQAEHRLGANMNGTVQTVFAQTQNFEGSTYIAQTNLVTVPNLETTPTAYYESTITVGQSPAVTIYGRGYILPNGDV